MTKKLCSILILICLSSCYSYDSKSYKNGSNYVTYKTDHSYFWGLQKEEYGAQCNNSKSTKIESDNGFWTYFARVYTLGIYWPRTVKVECLEKLYK